MSENENKIPETNTPEAGATEPSATEAGKAGKKNKEKAQAEKLVKIRLPIIPGKEKQEAQFVRVNNRTWTIPRGIEMEVPECVVEVLKHSEDALQEALQYQLANEKG